MAERARANFRAAVEPRDNLATQQRRCRAVHRCCGTARRSRRRVQQPRLVVSDGLRHLLRGGRAPG